MMEAVMEEKRVKRYSEYKDSGEDWIGEIPKHWVFTKFKFITQIEKGRIPKQIVVNNNDLKFDLPPYLSMEYLRGGSINQLVKDNSAKIIDENETLLLWDGSNAGEFIKSRRGVVSSTVALISFEKIKKEYSWYYCKFIELELRKNTVGMGIPHVNGNELKNFTVTLPPLAEQAAIAEFLDKKTALIDQAIAIKDKQIELLKERKQILIQQAVTRGLNPKAKMKDSGVEWIGEIPEHWEVRRAKYLFNEINERSETGNEELLSVSHMTGVSPRSELSVNMFEAEDYSGSKLCRQGDLVYNIMWAWMGALGVSNYTGIVSPSYAVYRQKQPNSFNIWYLEDLLRCRTYVAHYNRVSTGLHSSRLRFYSTMFFEMPIAFPSIEEQNEIVDFIIKSADKISRSISIKEQEIEKLKEYKSCLINDAVTGKIKVC